VAFLLAQLGHHAAERFSERIATLGLTPPQAGILRAIDSAPGRSQQALSTELQLLPSRVVAFVDDLENSGYLERRPNPEDRRQYALYLTADGKELMRKLSRLARQHERALTAGLDESQRDRLCTPYSAPLGFPLPIGVRTAPTITASRPESPAITTSWV
jgi:DNA-binding MarR family transcriptional regulator